jgi:toxin FitB
VIVFDTNVLSEPMKPAPSARVVSWVRTVVATSVYVTTITQSEVLYGVRLLPPGRRRAAIEAAALAMFENEFAARVLPFGSDAATLYALIAAERRRAGRPISHFDAQIAAIARAVGATVATRNVADFEGCGIEVVNPWES